MPIGVFDSGLGGLTVLSALRAALPDQGFVYLGDHANAPYGSRPEGNILDLTRLGSKRLFDAGCNLVILACNTASAVALKPLQDYWVPADRRVLGVLVPVIEVVAGRSWADRRDPTPCPFQRVAFFATPATVRSGAFVRELSLRATGVGVTSQGCAGLVEALEAGNQADAEIVVAHHVAALLGRCADPQVAILGCTHYPLVQDAFAAHLPSQTAILSQPDIVAQSLQDYLTRYPRFRGMGIVQYLTTGSPDVVSQHARQLLQQDVSFVRV